jgi:hypothetical protein
MSLLLKVVAEVIGPVMASFELGPCDLAERDKIAAGKLLRASARKHCRGPSTPRIKPFVMRQICEALRSG